MIYIALVHKKGAFCSDWKAHYKIMSKEKGVMYHDRNCKSTRLAKKIW